MPQGIPRGLVVAAKEVHIKTYSKAARAWAATRSAQADVRSANTLSDLNRAPGWFFSLYAIEVLFAPGGSGAGNVAQPTHFLFELGRAASLCFSLWRHLRIKRKRVKLRLSSSIRFGESFPNIRERVSSSDASCIGEVLGDHVLHAACRVVERTGSMFVW